MAGWGDDATEITRNSGQFNTCRGWSNGSTLSGRNWITGKPSLTLKTALIKGLVLEEEKTF